jgi:pimeloyl-ACP methyl ester carboxylesterase
MSTLALTRTGTGPPLVLLHGLGSARTAWDPVVPALAQRFDVLAVDLPGFGDSAPLPGEPRPAALAAAVAGLLDDLGVATPHLAGNSLGGWVALELAGTRPVASLTLLSPAGLWRGPTPLHCRVSLRVSRLLARRGGAVATALVGTRPGRALVLGHVHGRPSVVTTEQARATVEAMARCPGFEPTLRATAERCYRAGPPIDAPVTVAFGSRDRILLRHRSRHVDELPPGTRVAELPGCGHVPMPDDPGAVTALIIAATERARPVRT